MNQIAIRVARRFLKEAKGMSLLPEFGKALEDYQRGDPGPMATLVNKVVDFISPGGGGPPAWFSALGTAKRNALKFLWKEGLALLHFLHPSTEGVKDMEIWRTYTVRKLQDWAKKLRTLELASEIAEPGRATTMDGFTIVPAPGVSRAKSEEALKALHEAVEKLRPVFPQVIYGDVYLSTHLKRNVAAWYVHSEDKFYLNVNAKYRVSNVYTIIHELGHRFYDKFFKDQELRSLFWELSTKKVYEVIPFDKDLRESVAKELLAAAKAYARKQPVPKLSDMAMLWVTTRYTPGYKIKNLNENYLAGYFDEKTYIQQVMGDEDINIQTDKVVHAPVHVTPYGGTRPTENFAESFAHYVLGMEMPPELKEIMEKLR